MNPQVQQLPYFDFLIDQMSSSSRLSSVFKDHVHWGLFALDFDEPLDDGAFARACDALSRKLMSMAQISDGLSILDVGCGFGGTTRIIADAHPSARVTGLNVDPRQLEVARRLTTAKNIEFVEGDACDMPFKNQTFDRLIAVESVFHFPSRLHFLKEAKRVLKSNGLLALSDFTLHGPKVPSAMLRTIRYGNPMEKFYGRVNATTHLGYKALALLSGLRFIAFDDVTNQTLPTYKFLRDLAVHEGQVGAPPDLANSFMEAMTVNGELRYALISMRA